MFDAASEIQAYDLALTKTGGKWQCAEVVADRSLGYGEYRWVISGNLRELDRQAVLGLFTYENQSREIDFELSRWGDAAKPNGQFVVQPYTVEVNLHRFDTGKATVLTISVMWREGSVRGQCWDGEDINAKPLADWIYTGRSVPRARPGNLWLLDGRAPASGTAQEIVIRSFEFKSAGNK